MSGAVSWYGAKLDMLDVKSAESSPKGFREGLMGSRTSKFGLRRAKNTSSGLCESASAQGRDDRATTRVDSKSGV